MDENHVVRIAALALVVEADFLDGEWPFVTGCILACLVWVWTMIPMQKKHQRFGDSVFRMVRFIISVIEVTEMSRLFQPGKDLRLFEGTCSAGPPLHPCCSKAAYR